MRSTSGRVLIAMVLICGLQTGCKLENVMDNWGAGERVPTNKHGVPKQSEPEFAEAPEFEE